MLKKILIYMLLLTGLVRVAVAEDVEFQNNYTCGIFNTVLTSYKTIQTQQNDVFNTCTISVKDYNLSEDEEHNMTCYTGSNTDQLCACNDGHCSVNHTCTIVPEPTNTLTYTVYETTKTDSYVVDSSWNYESDWNAGTTHEGRSTDINITFRNQEYGDFNFTNDVSYINLLPENTYSDNNDIKVMLLGDVIFAGNSQTLTMDGGDYYFRSFKIDKETNGNINQINICAKDDVRIFVKNDFVYSGNHVNDAGCGGKIFIYVEGDAEIDANGGGSSDIPIYIYVKGDVNIENSGNSNDWVGAITAEGTIDITGQNINFIYDDGASDFGYGECQLCYAYSDEGNLFNFFDFLQVQFNLLDPRDMAIINTSDETLQDVNVTQEENTSGYIRGNAVCYSVVDQNGEEQDDIDVDVEYSGVGVVAGDCVVGGLGDTNTTAYYGDYENGGFDNYLAIRTRGISGQFLGTQTLGFYADYYDQSGKHYSVKLDYCDLGNTPPNDALQTGNFDAWDIDRDQNDRHISTKIVGTDYNLTIAYIQDENSSLSENNVSVMFFVAKDEDNKLIQISEYKRFSLLNPQQNYGFSFTNSDDSTVRMLREEAVKRAAIVFDVCSNYDGEKYTIYDYDDCKLDNGATNYCESNDEENRICMRRFRSSDEFAIRPYAFRVFGNNQYKRAGEEFNLTIKAVDQANNDITSGNINDITGVINYKEAMDVLNIESQFYTPTASELAQMQADTGENNVSYCPFAGTFTIVNNDTFNNGEVNATVKFSETGILTVKVSEKPGSEFAIVDSGDTSDDQRYIQPATVITDMSDLNATDVLLFIPYEFNTTAEYNTTTGDNWLYDSNDVNVSNTTYQPPLMAAFVKYKIIALNKDGQITKNYTKTCFPDVDDACPKVNGLKLNSTFDLFLDVDMNTTKDINVSFYTHDITNDSAVFTPNKVYSLSKNSENAIREAVYPESFLNGESDVKVFFNVNKIYNTPIEPVYVKVLDANTSTSWMGNTGATKIFNGSVLNKTIEFRYGRIKTKNASAYSSDINTTFEFQYWTQNDGWVRNTQHVNVNYGDFNHTLNTQLNPYVTVTSAANINSGVEDVKFHTVHALPYSAKVHLQISPWLWYHPLAKDYKDPSPTNTDCLTHPCIKLDFMKSGSGWGGVQAVNNNTFSEENRTSDMNMSTPDVNVSKSQVKKINW